MTNPEPNPKQQTKNARSVIQLLCAQVLTQGIDRLQVHLAQGMLIICE